MLRWEIRREHPSRCHGRHAHQFGHKAHRSQTRMSIFLIDDFVALIDSLASIHTGTLRRLTVRSNWRWKASRRIARLEPKFNDPGTKHSISPASRHFIILRTSCQVLIMTLHDSHDSFLLFTIQIRWKIHLLYGISEVHDLRLLDTQRFYPQETKFGVLCYPRS